MVVIEAMSQRLPVVATPVGCARTLIDKRIDRPDRARRAIRQALASGADRAPSATRPLRTRLAAAAFDVVRDMTWTRDRQAHAGRVRESAREWPWLKPALTVGVATRNRPQSLLRCLDSLDAARRPGDRSHRRRRFERSAGRRPCCRRAAVAGVDGRADARGAADRSEGYIVGAQHDRAARRRTTASCSWTTMRILLTAMRFGEAVDLMEQHAEVAAIGCAQAEADGRPWPAGMQPRRRFLSLSRAVVTSGSRICSVARPSSRWAVTARNFTSTAKKKDSARARCDAGYHVVYLPDVLVAHVPDPAGRSATRYLPLRGPQRLPVRALQPAVAGDVRQSSGSPRALFLDACRRIGQRSRRLRLDCCRSWRARSRQCCGGERRCVVERVRMAQAAGATHRRGPRDRSHDHEATTRLAHDRPFVLRRVNRRLPHELARHGRLGRHRRRARTISRGLRLAHAAAGCRGTCTAVPVPVHFSRRVHLMLYGRAWRAAGATLGSRALLGGAVHRRGSPGRRRVDPKVPLVFATFQNISKRYPPPFNWIERHALHRADGIIAFGRTTSTSWIGRGFALPGRASSRPAWISTSFARPCAARRDVEQPRLAGAAYRWSGFSADSSLRRASRCSSRRSIALRRRGVPCSSGSGPLEPMPSAWARRHDNRVRIADERANMPTFRLSQCHGSSCAHRA